MENLLFDDQDFLADGLADRFRESFPDGPGRDAHGFLQSATRSRSRRMATGVIFVRGADDEQ